MPQIQWLLQNIRLYNKLRNGYRGRRVKWATGTATSCVGVVKDANWHAAMEEEMHALVENETWDLVDAPKGVK